MKKISKGLIIALGLVPGVGFAQKTVTVDVKSNVHSISKFIYGTNESYEHSTAARWGGNRSTSYNWENNASNGGNDYNFISDNFYDYSGNTTPAYPILNAVKNADGKGQYSLVSLQAAGYVAADKSGNVSQDEIAPSNRWKPISFHKNEAYTLTPDVSDDTVYIDELINYLSVKLGKAEDGGVSAFAIDNEPYLWNSTHARMHPEATSPDELIEKTVALSTVIRNLAPGAEIFGPMFFGYSDAFHWSGSLSNDSWWKSIQKRSKNYTPINNKPYNWFVDYYLDTLFGVEQATGIRPIDAVAFHWYPESYGQVTKKRIVDTGNDNVSAADMVAEDMIEARLQAPRGLWDSEYAYYGADGAESYVSRNSGRAIISKIKKSIDEFYPGTKIAFTEFEYDAENHWSGGLCLVDVLGVFGREDVYLACKWDVFQAYSTAAYNLYLDYDGEGSQFGSTSVYAMMSDTASLSSFASLDDEKNLHIIVVNKTSENQATIFNINNGLYTDGVVYGFGQFSSTITKFGTIDKVKNSSFSYELPAYSAVHIILNATPQTKLTNAVVTDENSDEIVLSFDSEVNLVLAEDAKQEFIVSVEGVEYEVSSVSCPSENSVSVKLANEIKPTDNNIKISYLGTNVTGISKQPISFFDTVYVHNELAGAPIYVLSADIEPIGTFVKLTVSKGIETIANNGGIVLKQDEQVVDLDSVKVYATSPYELFLYPSQRIFKYHTTSIENENSTDVTAKDGSGFVNFSIMKIGGANYAPTIDSLVISDNYTIRVYFNTNMSPDVDYTNAGFSILSEKGEIPFVASYKKNTCQLVLETENPLAANTDYTLVYTDNGKVVTIHDGVLESFSSLLENDLEDMGAKIVNVPSEVIQADQYWYSIGSPVVEDCSDESELGNSKHLGYIFTDDIYTYKINVEKTRNYTVYVRYASEREGEFNFIIDEQQYHMTLPSTRSFSKWKDAYRVIPLTEGEHDIKIQIINSGFNLNYMNFVEEEIYPVSKVTKARIGMDGDNVRLTFSANIDVLPEPEDVELIVNDSVSVLASSVEFSSSNVLSFTLDTVIYMGSTVKLKFASETIVTVDGGSVEVAEITVTNNSTKKYVPPIIESIVSVAEEQIKIAPVPARINQEITVTLDNDMESSYMIISSDGSVIKKGRFINNTSCILISPGVYTILIKNGDNEFSKKIIVQ